MVKAKKQTSIEKLKAKGKDFKAYHIITEFKNPDAVAGKYKMVITKIKECPNFKMYFCTWEMNPTHLDRVTWGNVDICNFKGHRIGERVGTSESFSEEMSMPAENWGADVPDDVRFFIKDSIMSLITEMKAYEGNWSSAQGKAYGIPMASINKYMETVTGVVMARTKKTIPSRYVKDVIEIDEKSGDVEFSD